MTHSSELRILSAADLPDLLPLREAIDAQRDAFLGLATGEAFLAPRLLCPGPHGEMDFVYAARLTQTAGLVAKIGAVASANREHGLPSVSATLVALDATTGRPRAIVDGERVTTLRTTAASMLAAQTLSPRSHRIAVIGYGALGRSHAAAAVEVFDPDEVSLWSPDLPDHPALPSRMRPARSAADAVAGADLVFTCTTSRTPVLASEWLPDGCVVISVGSFAPERREVGTDLVSRSTVVVDDVATAVAQAGPIRHAIAEQALRPTDVTSIGDVLLAGLERPAADRWTYYNSVGLGIQDAAIVELLVDRAEAHDLGAVLPW